MSERTSNLYGWFGSWIPELVTLNPFLLKPLRWLTQEQINPEEGYFKPIDTGNDKEVRALANFVRRYGLQEMSFVVLGAFPNMNNVKDILGNGFQITTEALAVNSVDHPAFESNVLKLTVRKPDQ